MNGFKFITLVIISFVLGETTYASFPSIRANQQYQSGLANDEKLDVSHISNLQDIVNPIDSKLETRQKTVRERITTLVNKYLKKANGDWDILSILGFTFGVLGVLLFIGGSILFLPFGIAAIVFSSIGLKRSLLKGKGFAIIGLFLGILIVLVVFLGIPLAIMLSGG